MSIALVIPYFGRLPWYFNYFLHSCRYNPEITFFIITDCREYREGPPDNVVFLFKTFGEMRQLAEERLQMRIALENKYKLCDLKPTYGILFPELIERYDFWGHCDMDVIFGHIRGFITDDILNNYDIISVRPEYITGFFALYRNTEKINRLFERSVSYKKVFATPSCMGFDECCLLCDPLADGVPLEELPSEPESMTHVVRRLANKGEIRAYFEFHAIEGNPGNLYWNAGKLIYNDEFEVLLYHLARFKTRPELKLPGWRKIPSSFHITETGFSKTKPPVNAAP